MTILQKTGVALVAIGIALLIGSCVISKSAEGEAAARELETQKQIAQALQNGSGTGGGIDVRSVSSPGKVPGLLGLVSILAGAALLSGKVGRSPDASENTARAAVAVTVPLSSSGPGIDEIIEDLKARSDPITGQFPGEDLLREAISTLNAGQKVQVVKLIRDSTGCSLSEAKKLSDDLQASLRRLRH